jgi:hypothetical protein
MTHLEIETFEAHFRRAFQGLRSALIELFVATEADPSVPQEVARRFGLNRGLTWKVSRIAAAAEPFEVYPQIPGTAAIAILLRAFKKAGADREHLEAVSSAFVEFDRMVELHAGDRATLELMVESYAAGQGRFESLETSRKLAFRGNSGIRGLQAKARIRTTVLSPSADDSDLLDTIQISGMIQLRRFRSNASWPLFVKRNFNDDGSALEDTLQPLFPGSEGTDYLLPEFCSLPLPEIRVVACDRGNTYELGEGPVGNSGSVDLLYGSISKRFASRFRDGVNEYGECFAEINAPVEHLLFDLIVHEELAERVEVETKLLQGEESRPRLGRQAVELPCPEQAQDLGNARQAASTQRMPRYRAMLESVFERVGWDLDRYRIFRLEMKYPPLPSVVLLRFPLESRPE